MVERTSTSRRSAMRHSIFLPVCSSLAVLGMAAALLPANAADRIRCSGHELLSKPRPEGSCSDLKPRIYPSPDGAARAVVFPADISLDSTPDMESRVVLRGSKGDTLTSKDHSSPRGMNGYYVVTAKWSPDSQFFVYSLSSSGGHSPWSFPMMVYGRKKNVIAAFSDMIQGNPTVSGDFNFTGPHSVTASTWKQPGSPDDKVPVTVDLDAAFGKLPPASE
jgi:hypothetical protein